MKLINIPLSILTLLIFFTGSLTAGRIDDDLQLAIKGKSPNEMVELWISLKTDYNASSFKKSLSARGNTRKERYDIAINTLKAEASKQNQLIGHLKGMAKSARVENIKGHWIANIIEATMPIAELNTLADRTDIDVIYEKPKIELIAPPEPTDISPSNSPNNAKGILGSNLIHIRADQAWAMGYTGKGRIVCSFDTGVDGIHPALHGSWKGNDGDSAAAWYDPVDKQTFPHIIQSSLSRSHGTHTTGIMVGNEKDTVGVAPGAKWIAAAVIDIPGASILDAFEWAANPDGNPNTIADIPDVINHSWGWRGLGCTPVFYDAIDNTEALGIVNIFAAGNFGPSAMTIINPAIRAQNSIDCFAVGNLNSTLSPPEIYSDVWASSRGPSSCNGAIKPNVVAPGFDIRSTWPGGGYFNWFGTSMAAPHVSGLVALLREKNPDATVNEIKSAILNSTQVFNSFGPLPNNTYGWGEIDCVKALAAIASTSPDPSVRLYNFNTPTPISPGDTVVGSIMVQNNGASVSNLIATITGSNPALRVINASVLFIGTVNQNDTATSINDFKVVVSDTVTPGTILSVEITFSGISGSYITTGNLYFPIEPPGEKIIANHELGRLRCSVSNFGVLGLGPNSSTSTFPSGGIGFMFEDNRNTLWEGGLMIGMGYGQVSSGVHSFLFEPDMDFKVAPGGNMVVTTPGTSADQETYSVFNDDGSSNPIGLTITQRSFAFNPPDDDYLILQYIIKNSSSGFRSGILVGLFLDWELPYFNAPDAGGYDAAEQIAWMAATSTGSNELSNYRGLILIKGDLKSAGAVKSGSAGQNIYPPISSFPGDGFSTSKKYAILSSGMLYANNNTSSKTDLFQFMSAGPITLASHQEDTVTFAILAGSTIAEIADAARRAKSVVTATDDNLGDNLLPSAFILHNNFPNPFNPGTMISFEMPQRGEYSLEVINMLGQIVFRKLGVVEAGLVQIEWDGSNFASGAYLYRVTATNKSMTKKMLLLK